MDRGGSRKIIIIKICALSDATKTEETDEADETEGTEISTDLRQIKFFLRRINSDILAYE